MSPSSKIARICSRLVMRKRSASSTITMLVGSTIWRRLSEYAPRRRCPPACFQKRVHGPPPILDRLAQFASSFIARSYELTQRHGLPGQFLAHSPVKEPVLVEDATHLPVGRQELATVVGYAAYLPVDGSRCRRWPLQGETLHEIDHLPAAIVGAPHADETGEAMAAANPASTRPCCHVWTPRRTQADTRSCPYDCRK